MNFDRKEANYQARPMSSDTGKGGKVGHDVKTLFDKYTKHGPMFDMREFEHALKDIKAQGNDTAYVEKVRELFIEELSKVKSYSRKFSDRIVDKLGGHNLSDGQVLEYVNQQGKKKGLSDYIIEAIFREVSQILSDRPSRTPYFRYVPSSKTRVGKALGYAGVESYDHFSNQKHDAIKALREVSSMTASVHSNVVSQTLQYEDSSIDSLTGTFDPTKHDRYVHIHPLIAALYVPKIRILEEVTLFASIADVVLKRANNEPIATRPDFELFHNIVHDRNESVCDHKDGLNDLKMRADIQFALWKAVLALRSGRYYDQAGLQLLQALNNCRYYRYQAMDLMNGDEGDMARRLLATFSLRPIKVRTLPVLPPQAMTLSTPFVNTELQNGLVEGISMVNIRLAMYSDNTPAPRIEHVLRTNEFFYDHASRQIIPKITQILTTNELLMIYIHRRQMVVPLSRFNGPFTFRDLPTTNKDYFSLNLTSVVVDREMVLNNEVYDLRSVVCTKLTEFKDSNGVTRMIPQGSDAVIFPDVNAGIDLPTSTYIVYDPAGVNKRLGLGGDVIQEQPMTTQTFNTSNDDLAQKIATQGVVVVYTKRSADPLFIQ